MIGVGLEKHSDGGGVRMGNVGNSYLFQHGLFFCCSLIILSWFYVLQ